MKVATILLLLLVTSIHLQAKTVVSQSPVNGGGTLRSSKLWIDPSPDNNNLDGDSICYDEFVLSNATTINHIEWWGDPQPELGFQIEFWKQDPGTTAYQPYSVFREQGAQPECEFMSTGFTASTDNSNTTHYSLDLLNPVKLAANDAGNPRWFFSIIGLTDQVTTKWNWAQGIDSMNKTYQFIRSGNIHGSDLYTSLPEGRAFLLADPSAVTTVPEPSTLIALGTGISMLAYLRRRR